MSLCLRFVLMLISIFACVPGAVFAQKIVIGLQVAAHPGAQCNVPDKRFAPWEMPFRLPLRLKSNALYESASFYAVVLRRDRETDCDGGEFGKRLETFRQQVQLQFSVRKVFASHQCPDMAAVSYVVDGRPDNTVFVAVFAGNSKAEALSVLATARKTYRNAALHRMRVNFSRVVQ